MPLSIKDPETDELARRLARETGESLTEAVRRALQERLEREQRRRSALAGRLLDIGRRCADAVEPSSHSSDHARLLYDESGLPR
jgi:antitoxin VapB